MIFLAHMYSPENCAYSPCGKSGVCKGISILLANVNDYVEQEKNGSVRLNSVPEGYTPVHNDLDFLTLIPHDTTCEAEKSENEDEPYLVEKIVQKRFRSNQYEYLVKWHGYVDSDNTWELPINIPSNLLFDYEKNLATPSTSYPRREGLRQSKKSKDFM